MAIVKVRFFIKPIESRINKVTILDEKGFGVLPSTKYKSNIGTRCFTISILLKNSIENEINKAGMPIVNTINNNDFLEKKFVKRTKGAMIIKL